MARRSHPFLPAEPAVWATTRSALRAARPFARRLFRKVAARKARSRAAAARAPGLKADAWASTRSKHVHGAPTSSRVDAASTAELSLDKARTENSHAWMTICGDSFGELFWTGASGPGRGAHTAVTLQASEERPSRVGRPAAASHRRRGAKGVHRWRPGCPVLIGTLCAQTSAAGWQACRARRRRWGTRGAGGWRLPSRGHGALPTQAQRGTLGGRGCCC